MTLKDFAQYKPLFLRANRALGMAFVEHKLVTAEQLDAANARLLEFIKNGEYKLASLLSILLNTNDSLKEDALIQYQMDTHELGIINLTSYNLERSLDPRLDLAACYATRTLPYERQEEFVFLATNFYLSEAVRKFWRERYANLALIWSVTTAVNMAESLERAELKKGTS